MKKLVGAVTAAATLALGVVAIPVASDAASPPATPAVTSIAWHACSDPDLQAAGAKCALLSVPLDYAHPTGRHIKIAISRILHTSSAARYQGVMVTNPGGPGGSGLSLPAYLVPAVPGGVATYYDWIGFDPRGVGESVPTLRCQPNVLGYHRPSFRPTTAKLLHTWLKRSKSYARACERHQPALLKHVTTRDSARDINSIRKALGVSQISYYGYSYGTYLGPVFSTLYPTRIKRMVLDSNVDPRGVWYKANLQQDVAFERNINIWFGWVAKYHAVYHLGTTRKAVRHVYYSQLKKLAVHPAGGKIGPDEWTDVFLTAGYYAFTWEELATVMNAWVKHHDVRPLKAEYDDTNAPGDDNEYAMYTATQCTDAPWPKKWSTWQRDNTRIDKKAPFLTWDNAWYNAPCLYWGAKAHHPTKLSGRAPSVLLIDQTLDAATPYEGSLYLRRLFPHSSLLAEPGGVTHADSLGGNTCVDSIIATYLATGKRPVRQSWNGPDALCRPTPRPVPHALTPLQQRSTVSPLVRTLMAGRL